MGVGKGFVVHPSGICAKNGKKSIFPHKEEEELEGTTLKVFLVPFYSLQGDTGNRFVAFNVS